MATNARSPQDKQTKKKKKRERVDPVCCTRGEEGKKERGSEAGERGEHDPILLYFFLSTLVLILVSPPLQSHPILLLLIALCFELQPTIVTLCLCYAHKKANESRKRNAMRWRSRFHSIPTIGQHECEGGEEGKEKRI